MGAVSTARLPPLNAPRVIHQPTPWFKRGGAGRVAKADGARQNTDVRAQRSTKRQVPDLPFWTSEVAAAGSHKAHRWTTGKAAPEVEGVEGMKCGCGCCAGVSGCVCVSVSGVCVGEGEGGLTTISRSAEAMKKATYRTYVGQTRSRFMRHPCAQRPAKNAWSPQERRGSVSSD